VIPSGIEPATFRLVAQCPAPTEAPSRAPVCRVYSGENVETHRVCCSQVKASLWASYRVGWSTSCSSETSVQNV